MANLFFRFPRLLVLAIGFIVLTGVSSYMNIPRQEDPTMTERFAWIETFMAGASAVRMESLVTEKVETALREIPEIKQISSTSRAGHSVINAELYDFVHKDEVDLVWSEVRDKLSDVEADLPAAATAPDLNQRGPVAVTLGIAILGDRTPLSVLERIADELKTRLAALPGTMETEIYGEPEQELLVQLDPYALARANLSLPEVMQLISDSDTKVAAGQMTNELQSLVVEVKGDLSSIERVAAIPLPHSGTQRYLRLSDIADVSKHYADPVKTLALINGERGIVVTTTMETGRRVDQWIAGAKVIVDDYERELPGMVRLETLIDQNHYTEERLGTLLLNLLLAIVLVLIALLFLMGIRSAIIVGTALPLTLALVVTGLHLMDIPLHQMSVTGLIIALGLLIDNAIVVVEEYKIRKQGGADNGDAIAQAVRHLFIPLLASTATTAFAFLPIATTPGGVGDFTGSMAVAVVLSVSASFLLAMTVVPSIAGFIDNRYPTPVESNHWWNNGVSPGALLTTYSAAVNFVCRKPWAGIGASLVLPICGFLLAGTMTSSFFPPVDRNQFQVQITLPASTSVTETLSEVSRVRRYLDAIPEITESHWFVGEGAPAVYYNMIGNNDGVASFANAFVTTADVDDPRKILPDLQRQLMNEFPNARVMALPFEQGPPFSAPVEIRIVGPDLTTLKTLGEKIRLVLSDTQDVTYTTATLSGTTPQVSVYPNENMARRLGLSNQQIPRQLNGELNGLIAGSVMEGSAQIPVRIRLNDNARSNPGEINSLPVIAANGFSGYAGIPLEQVATIALEPSPTRIDRHQNERINTVAGFLLPYAYPSVAVEDFRRRMADQNIELSPGYRIEFGGEEEQRGEAVSNIVGTFLTFLWLMVAVIVLSLNSFRHAGIIGIVGLLSVGLALLGVWMSGYPLGYTALIGTLGLVGLAINGAIIVLSALRADRAATSGDIEATTRVVIRSSRHIVSTTVTTIGGFIPLIVFGGHFWPPLAMAIAGGVTGSAVLALFLVPSMFSWYVARDQRRIQESSASAAGEIVSA